MLAYIRKNANSFVVWLIIGAIALVFVFFGMGRGGDGERGFIRVNGEDADYEEFQELLRVAGADSGDERAGRLAAAGELVNRLLTRQFSEAVGLTPSRETVMKTVAAQPAFQVDGRFDMDRYRMVLKAQRRDPSSFEREMRRNLGSEMAASLVVGLAGLRRPELAELFHFQEDRARFDYIFLAGEDGGWDLSQPAEEAVAAYYAANRERWRRPEEMTARYVEISPADFLDKAEISEADLEEYYEDSLDRFQRPEAARVSHILFAFPSLTPSEEDEKAALAKAEAALKRLSGGEDFAALAKELSDDQATREAGGDMGFITRGTTEPAFEEAAFAAPLNRPAGPVRTYAGYQALLVSEKRPAGPSPLAEARDELTGELRAIRARGLATRLLEDLLSRAEVNPDLEAAARSLGLRAALSRPFTLDDPPGFFEGDEQAARRAFSVPVGRLAPPLEGERTLVVYVPVSRQESRVPPLEEVRAQAEEAWRAAENDRLTRELLESRLPEIRSQGWEAFVAALPPGGPLKSGSGPLASRFGQTSAPPFDRSEPQAVAVLAFSAVRPGWISSSSLAGRLEDRPGRFLLRLAEFQPAEESRLDGPEGRTFQSLLGMNKANLIFQLWRVGLYEASKDDVFVPERVIQ